MAQRRSARRGQGRIASEHEGRVVAGGAEKLAVHLDAGDAEARHARLAGAEHVALAAQLQILFGNAEAVLGLAHDGKAGLRGLAERRLVEQKTARMPGAAADPSP